MVNFLFGMLVGSIATITILIIIGMKRRNK